MVIMSTAANITHQTESGAVARTFLVAVWLLLVLVPATRTMAQYDTFEAVRDYMDRTMEIMMRSEDAVRESDSARARRVFDEAEKLQAHSEQLWVQGRPRLAFKASQRARLAAGHAARIARDDLTYEERTRMRLERLRDLHIQVLDRVMEVNDQRVLRFVREAERQFHRARELYVQRDFEMAFNLLESAEKILRRAARLLFEGEGIGRLENELERTREFLSEARERLGQDADPAALNLLQRADALFQQAHESMAKGEPFRALQLMRQARRLAGQALTMVGGGPSAESIQAQIDRWNVRLERVADAVAESGSEEARMVLDRAQRYRRRSAELLQEDDRVGALRQITIAHDLLSKANELTR